MLSFRGEELNYYSGECPLYNMNKLFTTGRSTPSQGNYAPGP
jgi:hypothetical protein